MATITTRKDKNGVTRRFPKFDQITLFATEPKNSVSTWVQSILFCSCNCGGRGVNSYDSKGTSASNSRWKFYRAI